MAPDLPTAPVTNVPTCFTLGPHAIFESCPMCDSPMYPEHAHYRCSACGWRDICCD